MGKKGGGIPDIVRLNYDAEPLIIQGAASRSVFFNDKYKPLQFLHFSDIHASADLWGRVVDFVDYYSDRIEFALHTGDYCGATQQNYSDLYKLSKPKLRPVLNCVGNHDTYESKDKKNSTKDRVYGMLFGNTDGWNVRFMDGDNSMSYLKDFPDSRVRLIVLDQYYGGEMQTEWLRTVLCEALESGYHVLTAAHEITGPVTKKLDVSFSCIDAYESLGRHCNRATHPEIDCAIADFKADGGIHICHLAGHEHWDMIGYTDSDILNCVVECATDWDGWCDCRRVKGTRTYDCFNVVAVDTCLGVIKLVRIGNGVDHYLRIKRAMCYDYLKGKIISSC